MITHRLLAVLLIDLVLWLVLIYTGYVNLFFFLITLLLWPLFSLLQTLFILKRLKITQTLERPVIVRGEAVDLHLVMHNRSPLSLPWLQIQVRTFFPKLHPQTVVKDFSILAGREVTLQVSHKVRHCGSFRIGTSQVGTRDLFGFFRLPLRRAGFWKKEQMNLIVIPGLLPYDDLHALRERIHEHQKLNSRQISHEVDALANIRAMQPGDSLKRIHWKLSARAGTYLIKEFEDPRQQQICLLLDPKRTTRDESAWTDRDNMLEHAASLTALLLSQRLPVRLVTHQPERFQQAGSQLGDLDILRIQMALSTWQDDRRILDVVRLETQFTPIDLLILLIYDVTQDLADYLAMYQANGHDVWVFWLDLPEPAVLAGLAGQVNTVQAEQNKTFHRNVHMQFEAAGILSLDLPWRGGPRL